MGLFGSFVQAFKDGYNGVDEEQDAAPSTKGNTAQKPAPAKETAPAQKQAASEEPKFCGACGASLEPGTKFCPKCGKPVMGVAPEGQAAPAEPPHLMPTNTLHAYLETVGMEIDQSYLLEGAAAFQVVTHADPVFGTQEVNSYFLLRGDRAPIQEVARNIREISEDIFHAQLHINVDTLAEDYRQVIRIKSANVEARFEDMVSLTLVQENVMDGAVYYLYLSGDLLELTAKHDALTPDENKRLEEFNSRSYDYRDFASNAKAVVLTAFGFMNNHQMNG